MSEKLWGLLPICSRPDVFFEFRRHSENLAAPDSLFLCAMAIGRYGDEQMSVDDADATLQRLADEVRLRTKSRQPRALLANLHCVLFDEDEGGFTGNTEDYYALENNSLPVVLKTRRGLPVALSLIYKEVARRVGIRVNGINTPGHFLVSVDIGEGKMLVDCFSHGREVSEEEVLDRVHAIFGDEVENSPSLFAPATPRLWLTRMLQNLLNTYGSKGMYAEVAGTLELEAILWPSEVRLKRDLALVLARVGLSEPAAKLLASYLSECPDDRQKKDLEQLLRVLEG